MPRPERQVLVCVNSRPPGNPKGSCGEKGGQELFDRLLPRERNIVYDAGNFLGVLPYITVPTPVPAAFEVIADARHRDVEQPARTGLGRRRPRRGDEGFAAHAGGERGADERTTGGGVFFHGVKFEAESMAARALVRGAVPRGLC